MTKPKSSRTSSSKLPDVPTIRVAGDFSDRVGVVNATPMSVLVGLGEADTTDVLVPLVNVQIIGGSEEQNDGERVFSTTLTLENTAFMVADMTDELKNVFGQLAKISTGGLAIEKFRAEAIKHFLESSVQSIAECLKTLDQLSQPKK